MKHYKKRVQQIRDYILSHNIDCVLIFGSHEYPGYIMYLTGISTKSPATYFCITKNNEFFLEIGYMAADLRRQAHCKVYEFEDENTISTDMNTFLTAYNNLGVIGLAPYIHLIKIQKNIKNMTAFGDTLLVQKSLKEIAEITNIATSLKEIFDLIGFTIHVGMSEKELAQYIQEESFKRAEKFSFPLNIVSGKRIQDATIGEPTDYVFRDGDIVSIDMGLYKNGFYTDATRIFFLNNYEAEKRYQVLCDINEQVAESIRPETTTIGQIKNLYIKLLKKNSMPYDTLEIPYLGHSIGFFLHEQPFLYQEQYDKTVIPAGMVFTLEPEITYPDYHLRIEDMYVSTKQNIHKVT